MAILDLFSNRQKREQGGVPDVYTYDQLPQPLRVQIVYILQDVIGKPFSGGYETSAFSVSQRLVDELSRHFGRIRLAKGQFGEEILANFLLNEPQTEYCLDAVELTLRAMEGVSNHDYRQQTNSKLGPSEAIADLNHRFLEHGVGYQYVSGKIIKADSQYLHEEVVKPTLALLLDKRYKGANDEFLKAHEHYRKDEIKDCLANCLKALESTLKTICTIRKWSFKPTDTAKTLIATCFTNGLIPSFLQAQYSALQSTLESGVPTVRNKLGGHGQGSQVVTVPPYFAAYALHLTGSAIQFLIDAEKSLP